MNFTCGRCCVAVGTVLATVEGLISLWGITITITFENQKESGECKHFMCLPGYMRNTV